MISYLHLHNICPESESIIKNYLLALSTGDGELLAIARTYMGEYSLTLIALTFSPVPLSDPLFTHTQTKPFHCNGGGIKSYYTVRVHTSRHPILTRQNYKSVLYRMKGECYTSGSSFFVVALISKVHTETTTEKRSTLCATQGQDNQKDFKTALSCCDVVGYGRVGATVRF